ncbi:hypothetical protein MMC13_001527 [Lambiella insularis]|nr:hypothetical protein [Lambiella insularis]
MSTETASGACSILKVLEDISAKLSHQTELLTLLGPQIESSTTHNTRAGTRADEDVPPNQQPGTRFNSDSTSTRLSTSTQEPSRGSDAVEVEDLQNNEVSDVPIIDFEDFDYNNQHPPRLKFSYRYNYPIELFPPRTWVIEEPDLTMPLGNLWRLMTYLKFVLGIGREAAFMRETKHSGNAATRIVFVTFSRKERTDILTIASFPSGKPDWEPVTELSRYWTIVLLEPKRNPMQIGIFDAFLEPSTYHAPYYPDTTVEWNAFSAYQLQTAVLYLALKVMRKAIKDWTKLLANFKEDLDNADIFLHLGSYETLLWDDDKWSTSTKYSWYINALSTMEQTVEGNRMDYHHYRNNSLQPLIEGCHNSNLGSEGRRESETSSNKEMSIIRGFMKEADTLCDQLKAQQKEFTDLRSGVIALRDGLHNISAPKEAKTATQLGMHVRYLTYVSITYLPLTFSTLLYWGSIFAIDGLLGEARVYYVMIVIAVSTYALVFKFKTVEKFFSIWIDKWRKLKAHVGKVILEYLKEPANLILASLQKLRAAVHDCIVKLYQQAVKWISQTYVRARKATNGETFELESAD